MHAHRLCQPAPQSQADPSWSDPDGFFFLSTSRARFLMTCNGIFLPPASLVAISYQTRMCFHYWQTVWRIWKALLSTEIVDLITSQSKVKVTLTFPLSSSCKQRLRNALRSSLDYGSKVNLELRINPFDLCWPKDRATLTYWFYMQIMTRMKSLTQAVKTVAFFHIFYSGPSLQFKCQLKFDGAIFRSRAF